MWAELSAAIITQIKTCSHIANANIFDHAKQDFDGYPAVTVFAAEGAGRFADTVRNERHYIFSVRVWQERLKQGPENSESLMRTIVDDLISIFDAAPYLDGQRLLGRGYCTPIPSAWRFIQGEQIDMRMAEILIDCVVIA